MKIRNKISVQFSQVWEIARIWIWLFLLHLFHKDMGAIRKHREPGRIRRNLGEARVTQGHLGNSGALGLRKLPQASLPPSGSP